MAARIVASFESMMDISWRVKTWVLDVVFDGWLDVAPKVLVSYCEA